MKHLKNKKLLKINLMNKKNIQIFLLSITFISCNNVIRVNNKETENTRIIKESDLTEPENYKGIKTCEEGKELAKKEIKNGKIKYIFAGYGSRQELPKNLEMLYDIEIINVGGVLGLPNDCYNDVMYKEIQSKYGNDAFNRAME